MICQFCGEITKFPCTSLSYSDDCYFFAEYEGRVEKAVKAMPPCSQPITAGKEDKGGMNLNPSKDFVERPAKPQPHKPIKVGDASIYRGGSLEPDIFPYNKIKSDGLATDYYKLPEHATELRHLISAKSMSKSRGDIFKSCYRLGEKEGIDVMYDLNKIKFFIEDLIQMYHRGEHL